VEIRALFGARLKQLREEKELTQEQLAEVIDVTPQHLSDIERGKYAPRFDKLPLIARTLGKPIRELFFFPEHPDI
jgi:transcriptional regulator with XRE-family HTH domain